MYQAFRSFLSSTTLAQCCHFLIEASHIFCPYDSLKFHLAASHCESSKFKQGKVAETSPSGCPELFNAPRSIILMATWVPSCQLHGLQKIHGETVKLTSLKLWVQLWKKPSISENHEKFTAFWRLLFWTCLQVQKAYRVAFLDDTWEHLAVAKGYS